MNPAVSVYKLHAGSCPYLDAREWVIFRFQLPEAHDSSTAYENLINNGWRRNARDIYRNTCPGCNRCIPIRIPVNEIVLSSSQRRACTKNKDLSVTLTSVGFTEEYTALYTKYQRSRHGETDALPDRHAERFFEFFCMSTVDTRFMEYRDREDRLVGLGLVDLLPRSVSSVYFVFDPDESRRSIGIFSIVTEAELAVSTGRHWLHLGFWVPGNPRMEYKAQFYPHETLGSAGWIRRNGPEDPVVLPRPWPLFAKTGELHGGEETESEDR